MLHSYCYITEMKHKNQGTCGIEKLLVLWFQMEMSPSRWKVWQQSASMVPGIGTESSLLKPQVRDWESKLEMV